MWYAQQCILGPSELQPGPEWLSSCELKHVELRDRSEVGERVVEGYLGGEQRQRSCPR